MEKIHKNIVKICMVLTNNIDYDTRVLNEASVLATDYQVTILTTSFLIPTIIKNKSFKIRRIENTRKTSLLGTFFTLIVLIKAAFRENPDIYHAHDLDGLLCAFMPALIKRKTLVYDSHELWTQMPNFGRHKIVRRFFPIIERITLLKVSNGITVNESIATYLQKRYKRPFISLRNCSAITKNRKGEFSLKKKFKNKKIVLHLGSTNEGRGAENMIKSARFLPKNFIMVFIGAGKRQEILSDLIKKYHLAKIVFFLPAVPPGEISDIIKEADIGLALTENLCLDFYYSLPNKIFQYIAGGLPILGSNFPEFKKVIIDHQIGEIVDPSKPKLIARKIIEMLKTQNQRKYRQNLANLAKKEFSWEKESQKLLDLYEKLERNR